MPIYEYQCKKCKERFEAIVSRTQSATCPACESTELEKQLSVFAVGATGGTAPELPSGCGGCEHATPRGQCQLK